ncbi:MAG: phosphoenolpyruvate synthase [Bacteriovorax sp. MedPE-SWde]|nr:MAG: phosphoenolpyruvate synthase [Bacteriovorax sp. MedPE-SWde]
MLYYFETLPKDKTSVGGKAYMLAMMTQIGVVVPQGLILDDLPTEEEFKKISEFAGSGDFTLAVRSSATGEDSKENSFAGQNSTFLFVDNDEDLKLAIENCFNSIHKESSRAYRKHFLGSDKEVPMNVVIQRMIDPAYSGVYFSRDPRGKIDGWMYEYIDGVGEDLVSGKRTPTIVSEGSNNYKEISESQENALLNYSRQVEAEYKDEFDIEWAIDKDGVVFILQARPITAKSSISNLKVLGKKELKRLEDNFSVNTVWDGQTFAEWTVAPTVLTTELWANSFRREQAFDLALKKLGYLGFKEDQNDSLLDTVFGKSYINLNKLGELYFGPIPYSIEPVPRPHLKFHFSKISPKVVFNTPKTVLRMIKVGLSINTHRKDMIEEATRELVNLSTLLKRPNDPEIYRSWSDQKLNERIAKECHLFHERTLVWPYVLISLTETTIQTLISLLKSIYPQDTANELIKKWSGQGINSETYEMGRYFKKACAKPEMRPLFLERYGHRGPGELDLSSKRWSEIGEDAFYDLSLEDYEKSKMSREDYDVEAEIEEMKTFKKSIVLEEWRILKSLLELREKWKMALLKPYCHIRFLLLEKERRLGIENESDIFWLSLEEVTHFEESMKTLIRERKAEAASLKNFNFSTVASLSEIKDVINGEIKVDNSLSGEGISAGIVKGEIVVINNPGDWKSVNWPNNPIVVAQSTDPGWTPVFTKASGIIVERGGVLSHCAIVAREMGIPAISGINQCHLRFKGGENVWIDGNTGTVKLV